MRQRSRTELVLRTVVVSVVLLSGCGDSTRPAPSPTAPSTGAPQPPPPPSASGQTILLGDPISGTISSESRCKFDEHEDPRFAGLCNVYTLVAPEDGTLTVTTRLLAGEGPLALTFRGSDGAIIDTFCCSGTGRTAAHQGVPIEIEIAYTGRPPGYPASVHTINYTLQASLVTGDLQPRGSVRTLIYGDSTRTQLLPGARLEVIDGPAAGRVAVFDPASGRYSLDNLAAGFVRVRASAAGFETAEHEIPVGTELPRDVVLARTVLLADSTHELSGMVPQPGSSNAVLTRVKVEILDGPLAGGFTFTDDDMGIYVLRSLPPGVMRVRASHGALSDTVSVDISGRSTYLVFHLSPQ